MKGLDLYGEHRLKGQHLVEVIVSPGSNLVGSTIKEAQFRHQFDAVVLAVRRGNSRLTGGLGKIELRGGDTLLLAPRITSYNVCYTKLLRWTTREAVDPDSGECPGLRGGGMTAPWRPRASGVKKGSMRDQGATGKDVLARPAKRQLGKAGCWPGGTA